MKPHITITATEMKIIDNIVTRARAWLTDHELHDIKMSIISTHLRVPLRLQDLLDADVADFVHDVGGIVWYFNSETLRLEGGWMPRFARDAAFNGG